MLIEFSPVVKLSGEILNRTELILHLDWFMYKIAASSEVWISHQKKIELIKKACRYPIFAYIII